MIVLDIQLRDAKHGMEQSTIQQLCIWNMSATQKETNDYTAVLLEQGAVVGPDGKVPHHKIQLSVIIRQHRYDDGALELSFRALRELRQEDPSLFQADEETDPRKMRARFDSMKLGQ